MTNRKGTTKKKTKSTKLVKETERSIAEKIRLYSFLTARRLVAIDAKAEVIDDCIKEFKEQREKIKGLKKDAESAKSTKEQKRLLQELLNVDKQCEKRIKELELSKKQVGSEKKLVRGSSESAPKSSYGG